MRKKTSILVTVLSIFILAGFTVVQDPPTARITNGILTANLYLPDAENGYYRGMRFDWSGVVNSLDYKGHHYFGVWNPHYSPTLHDAITGPVEVFEPLGYDTAKPGESFVKIGVGLLQKQSDSAYVFSRNYKILSHGNWKVKRKKDHVQFLHTLKDETGYGYTYAKTVRLTKGKPEMVLAHQLTNTGTKTIETTVYNHNFFVIDQEPTNENIVTSFPFKVKAEGKGFGTLILAEDNSLRFTRALRKGENVYTPAIGGYGTSENDYKIEISNLKSGASVNITSAD